MRTLTVASLLFLLAPGLALAQQAAPDETGARWLVAVFGFGQPSTSTTTATVVSRLYDESATTEVSQEFGGGGGFWLDAGYRISQRAYAGIAYSYTASGAKGSVSISAPHPLIYDAPRTATSAIDDAGQTVQGVHLWAGWRLPLRGPIDVLVTGGPSFVTARRDVAVAAEFEEGAAPFTSIVVNEPTLARRSGSAVGANVGAAVTYRLSRLLGASGFVRYVYAEPSIEGAAGSAKSSVAGLTLGGGLRVLF